MMTAEQILAAHKANVETFFSLTGKAFEGVEKMVELNTQVAKAAMVETADHAKAVLSVKDAQDLLALQAGLMQPLAEKMAAYTRHVYDIATATGADVSKIAEAQLTEAQKKGTAVMEAAFKNAPAGSESAVAMMKSAVTAANNAYDSVQKAVRQATDVAQANFDAVSKSATRAATNVTKMRKAA